MSYETIHYFNLVLGIGAIALVIISFVTFFVLFFGPKKNKFLAFIDKHFLELGFFISLSGTIFSLIYSEVINFAPCYLCWWARVFLYPQVILFGIALWSRDRKVIHYVIPLLFMGFLVSVYHNITYYFGNIDSAPCDATGVSCSQRLVSEFGGLISIPTLSLAALMGLLMVVVVAHFYGKRD